MTMVSSAQGLKALIKKQADVEVVGEAEDGNAAVEMASRLTPDVVIMDVTMPNLNGDRCHSCHYAKHALTLKSLPCQCIPTKQ